MTPIQLHNNSFNVCPSKLVYVKSNGEFVGHCMTCIKKWIFYTAFPNHYNDRWYTMDQMKQQYDNLEYFVEP